MKSRLDPKPDYTGTAYNGEIKGIAIGVFESLESEG